MRGTAGMGRNFPVAPEKALTGLPRTTPEALRISQKVPGSVLGHQPLVEALIVRVERTLQPRVNELQLLVDLVVEIAAQRRVGDDVGGD